MKKVFRTVMAAAVVLMSSAASVFADIAPLPEPEPAPAKSRSGILIVLVLIIVALAVLRAVLHKKNK